MNEDTDKNRPIGDYDNYQVAAEYAVWFALSKGDGKLLRSIKTLMDSRGSPKRQREINHERGDNV